MTAWGVMDKQTSKQTNIQTNKHALLISNSHGLCQNGPRPTRSQTGCKRESSCPSFKIHTTEEDDEGTPLTMSGFTYTKALPEPLLLH